MTGHEAQAIIHSMNGMNKPIEYILAQVDDEPYGRELGKDVRLHIESLLEDVEPGKFLTIQLAGVKVMDFSFSNEVFAKLIGKLSTSYPNKGLLFANPTEYVATNLSAALEALNMIALTTSGPTGWELIGKVLVSDTETMKIVHRRKQLTANDLVAELNLQQTTAIQRLKKLANFGVIVAAKEVGATGREQYMYKWLE